MYDDYGYEEFEENDFPLAYLLTFRTFGTWLHGDQRGSVGKHDHNVYGRPDRRASPELEDYMAWLAGKQVILGDLQFDLVEKAIVEVCDERSYLLHAVNVRTNHVHAVVSAEMKPERIINTFKSYSTRSLRKNGLSEDRNWSRGRSRKYLWKPAHVVRAIDYVLYSQDGERFELPEGE